MSFNFLKNNNEIERLSKISNFFEIVFIISLVVSAVLGSSTGWIPLCVAIFCGAAGAGLNSVRIEASTKMSDLCDVVAVLKEIQNELQWSRNNSIEKSLHSEVEKINGNLKNIDHALYEINRRLKNFEKIDLTKSRSL